MQGMEDTGAGEMPRTTIMRGTGDAPHNHHAGDGGCPAQPSCGERGMPRTTIMQGMGDTGAPPSEPGCLQWGGRWRSSSWDSCASTGAPCPEPECLQEGGGGAEQAPGLTRKYGV